jgi:hypothetical protein
VIAARLAAIALLATGCLSKPSFECTFEALPSELEARLGTQNGAERSTSDCGDRSVVGLGLAITSGINDTYDERTAVAATLRCATLSTSGGDYATGETSDVPVAGGNAMADGPFFASCPDGQVVVGLAAHIVNPAMDHLFNSVAIDCSAVDESGAATGAITRVPLVATGTRPPDIEVRCTGRKALHGLKSWVGSELDRVQLACGPTACLQPP